MRRRRILAGLLLLLAAPLVAEAQQQGKAARVGITVATDVYYDAFLQRLGELGWVAGQNLVVERRSVRGDRTQYGAMIAGLVAVKVDVIVATGTLVIEVARKATSATPVVGIDLESDPVASGFVASLARPGGSVTGIFLDLPELGGKQLEFLKETVPGLARVAVLWEPEIGEPQLRAAEEGARVIGVTLNALGVRRAEEIRPALERAARERAQALVVLTSPLFSANRRHIAELTQKYRLPTISLFTSFAEAGTLMAYGPSQPEMFRNAARYVDKILRGAKAGELPVERPTKFELVINRKTAKALGLTIPPSLLLRADQVIE
jgi:putative ABC transport system substrate-binding protein